MSAENTITKDSLHFYLKELAKEFRKRNGKKTPAEIILVGGAAVLANYGFREMTTDIDALIVASSAMKEAINAVGDRYGLPNGWLNSDFKQTRSYSAALAAHSDYYCTYSNILEIRTIRAEYLVAMKLVSGRRYKKDLSDIVGILYEQQKQGEPLSYAEVNRAMTELYGSWALVDDYSRAVFEKALTAPDLQQLLLQQAQEENDAKEAVLEIDKNYPDAVTEDNVDAIIQQALKKKAAEAEHEN